MLQGFLCLERNHELVGDEGLPSLKAPCGILTHFMLNDLLQILGEKSMVIHACIELMVPICWSQITLRSEASPCQPPMEKIHVCVASRHKIAPLRLLLPIRNHDRILMVKELHNVLISPLSIGDVSLHVGLPLLK